ncbi:uncharacterized mitochondrial protein AtMg00810-like [Cucumis melo]|uniref:Uncharacterized mitochondrial protein AtMg00810-like n=1 Tax=Cucumis melo TaxID=3656 RepID=A0ABM3KBQ8_CUCME|nr:uncharacterized mitochondrial protein AtMg00810-like [Cucumis melo]
MDVVASSNFSSISPLIFDGDNYQVWAVRMEAYMEALDIWEAVEEDYVIPALPDNLTMAQIKVQKEKKTKRSEAKAYLGFMSYFLGIEIKQGQGEVFICQKKYAKEILKKFKMDECKAVSTLMNQKEKLCKEDGVDKVDEGYFRSLIGCLMYLTATRPDILNFVSILSCFMHCASELHRKAAKRVIRYVKGTSDFGVKFTRGKEFKLIGFSDSDWGGSIDDMRSTLGYCFTLGYDVFSWSLKKQEIKESTEILVDIKAAIAISHTPMLYKKTKHFNIKLFFLKEVQKSGEVILVYCKTEDQVADILTKSLPTIKFGFLRSKLGVCNS